MSVYRRRRRGRGGSSSPRDDLATVSYSYVANVDAAAAIASVAGYYFVLCALHSAHELLLLCITTEKQLCATHVCFVLCAAEAQVAEQTEENTGAAMHGARPTGF